MDTSMAVTMMSEIREAAASEIAALKQARVNIEEIRALNKQYSIDAEDLQAQIDAEPAFGLSASAIVDYMNAKNKLMLELAGIQEAQKQIDNRFLSDAHVSWK